MPKPLIPDTIFCVKLIYIPPALWYNKYIQSHAIKDRGIKKGRYFMANRKDSKNRVLRNGETERKDGRYMYRYTDSKTGQRKTVYARDLPELREKEKSVLSDVEDNIRTDGNVKSLTVNDLFRHYLEIKEISDSTKVNYRSTWKNNVEGSIGRYKVVQVLPSDIKKLYSGLSQKGLAKSSIKRVHNLLHPVLEMAVDDDIIRRNPVKSVWGDYGHEPEEKKALTVGQQKQLMEFVKPDTIYNSQYFLRRISSHKYSTIGAIDTIPPQKKSLSTKQQDKPQNMACIKKQPMEHAISCLF